MVIKVCCVQSLEEARMAASAGATHIGLVGAMPSGPGPIDDDAIQAIAAGAPPEVVPVLLTAETEADRIVDHVRRTGVPAVQIVSHVSAAVRRGVRAALESVEIIQVVHVEGAESIAVAEEAATGADHVLLDSGRPSAPTPELGGTGRVHDWSVSAEIVRRLPVGVLLAGGLGPGNVGRAVDSVGPRGVDVCSGLRDESGALVPALLEAFAGAARRAEEKRVDS